MLSRLITIFVLFIICKLLYNVFIKKQKVQPNSNSPLHSNKKNVEEYIDYEEVK